jgi:electron transfer flavoprotein beta subunit
MLKAAAGGRRPDPSERRSGPSCPASDILLEVVLTEAPNLNVVALVKYVPEPQGTPTLGEDHLLVREGVDGALDPGDEFVVEAALQLVEAHGGEVTLVSMGPEIATSALRKGFSMGASGGVLVSDPALRGADALATAKVLAAAVSRSPFDLVLAGVESTDGYTGTLPMAVAELLGVPSATFARKVEVEGDALRVERQTEAGYDVVTCPMPALVTVTGSAAEPRYPTLKGIMAAKSKPLEQLSLAELGLSDADAAPSQRVTAVSEAPEKAAGVVVQAGDEAAAKVVELLAEAKAI